MLENMLGNLFSYIRRRVAESVLSGFHDATQALSNAASSAPESDVPAGVTLLLDGPKTTRKAK